MKIKIYKPKKEHLEKDGGTTSLLIIRSERDSIAFGHHHSEGKLNGQYGRNCWNWNYRGFELSKDEYIYIKDCEYIKGDILKYLYNNNIIDMEKLEKLKIPFNLSESVGIIDRKNSSISIIIKGRIYNMSLKGETYSYDVQRYLNHYIKKGLKIKQTL